MWSPKTSIPCSYQDPFNFQTNRVSSSQDFSHSQDPSNSGEICFITIEAENSGNHSWIDAIHWSTYDEGNLVEVIGKSKASRKWSYLMYAPSQDLRINGKGIGTRWNRVEDTSRNDSYVDIRNIFKVIVQGTHWSCEETVGLDWGIQRERLERDFREWRSCREISWYRRLRECNWRYSEERITFRELSRSGCFWISE